VLVLITLFTDPRATNLRELRESASAKKPDALQEMWLLAALFVVTAALFMSGLPVVVDAAKGWHPRASTGPLRSAFIISWALLLALIAWQAALWTTALQRYKELPRRPK